MSEPLSMLLGFALGAMSTDEGAKPVPEPPYFVIARWPTGHTLEVDLEVYLKIRGGGWDYTRRSRRREKSRRHVFIIRIPGGRTPGGEIVSIVLDQNDKHQQEWSVKAAPNQINPVLRSIILSSIFEVLAGPDVPLSDQAFQSLRLPVFVSATNFHQLQDQGKVWKARRTLADAWNRERMQPVFSKGKDRRPRLAKARAEYLNTVMAWIDQIPELKKGLKGTRARRHPISMTPTHTNTKARTWSLHTDSRPQRFLAMRFRGGDPLWSVYDATPQRWGHGEPDIDRTDLVADLESPFDALVQSGWLMLSKDWDAWLDAELELAGEPEETVDIGIFLALDQPNPYFLRYDDFVAWARAIQRSLP